MKKTITLFCIVLLNILALQVSAQDYKPYRKGLTYQYKYQGKDTIIAFRIDTSYALNQDSVFVFNSRRRHWSLEEDNLMGNRMVEQPNGDYLFITRFNTRYPDYSKPDSIIDTFLIKTKVDFSTTWKFANHYNITATYKERKQVNVLGEIDSVKVIELSDGNKIEISKKFGVVSTFNLDQYFYKNTSNQIEIDAIPELKKGVNANSIFTYFDFQVGDIFGFKRTKFDKFYYNLLWRILERTDYGQDSVKYRIARKIYSTPLKGLIVDTVDLLINRSGAKGADVFAWGDTFLDLELYTNKDWMLGRSKFTTEINGKYYLCDSIVEMQFYNRRLYEKGLGLTYLNIGNYEYEIEKLYCYKKGTDSLGSVAAFEANIVVAIENVTIKEVVTLYPNPANNQLYVSVENASQTMNIAILNPQGQVVKEYVNLNTAIGKESGIDISDLPEGMYYVRVNNTVQKFVKQNK